MKSSQAILLGAVLIAGTIVFVNTIQPAQAQRGSGPYQLMHHSNNQANSSVFRLDVNSGDVTYCYITPDTRLICVGEK